MRLLFLSSEPGELRQAVKWLLRAGVRCAVWEGGGLARYGVWVQDEEDFPRALRIRMQWTKPRPPPPWADLLDSVAAGSEGARSADGAVSEQGDGAQPPGDERE